MNEKLLCGYFECRHKKPRRTFANMQEEMEKIVADIDAIENMEIEYSIKLLALADLTEKKHKLLAEMHEELNRMYR
jgi:hypothetical protein